MGYAEERRGLRAIAATVALHRLAGAVLQRYTLAKARRAALDFEDLISKSASCSADSELAAWVLFKLDGGIDHILVDEAQDTSPSSGRSSRRWRASSSPARRAQRRAHAVRVGDEKQSIYSFQGAEPEHVRRDGQAFAAMAENAGRTWQRIPLDLSFRTVAPVLAAVDQRVCRSGRDARPVGRSRDRAPRRAPLGPRRPRRDLADGDAGRCRQRRPVDAARRSAATRARRAAGRAHRDDHPAAGSTAARCSAPRAGPSRAGDILILVRKRRPFAGADGRAHSRRAASLSPAPTACASAIRSRSQDLIVARRLPHAAGGRPGAGRGAEKPALRLRRRRPHGARRRAQGHAVEGTDRRMPATIAAIRAAADTLKRWRSRADFVPPFEFFASILDREGGARQAAVRASARRPPIRSTSSSTWRSATTIARRPRSPASSPTCARPTAR